MQHKVNKSEFLKSIAEKTGVPLATVKTVYTGIVDEIRTVVCNNDYLSLTGFGAFMLKSHKGHPVQFESRTEKVQDYEVLKFAASNILMSSIRQERKDNKD